MTPTTAPVLDRDRLLERFTAIRARTRAMFDLLEESVYYTRPIALRNPVVFYEGHLPAFAVNTLVRKGLGRPGIDPHLERIFERGIDPESEATAIARGNPAWPSRAAVQAYAAAADDVIADALATGDVDRAADYVWTILEHEEMHQETLAYMWHELPLAAKRKPALYTTVPPASAERPAQATVVIPGGRVRMGTDPQVEDFAWDNERPAHDADVEAFAVDALNVSNREFLAFVDAGGYRDRRWWRDEDWAAIEAASIAHPHFWTRGGDGFLWRGMFEHVPLPMAWPVYVTWAEAAAYARWRGARLMTEAEYHRAAGGGRYPWGGEMPRRAPANFDFQRWDPEPVGASRAAASPYGVYDLVGNGWEWTSTPFGPFAGFTAMAPYPEYSADFFDGDHFVLKGASPCTARGLVRPGFRNWFRPRYPYVYATFRCAVDL